jgi:hypothetical protein
MAPRKSQDSNKTIAAASPQHPLPSASSLQQQLYARFRSAYPTAGLVTELLKIEEKHYIVRAAVQMGETTLITGMAVAASLEEAEDQARIRVLGILGISLDSKGVELPDQSLSAGETELPLLSPLPSPSEEALPSYLTPPERGLPRDDRPDYAFTGMPRSSNGISSATVPEVVEDWSDELAQIDLELKRLGWTGQQESLYLQQNYGKSSRDYITDYGELLNFLSALRTLPSAAPAWKPSIVEKIPEASPDYSQWQSLPQEPVIPERSILMEQVTGECKRLGWTNRQGRDYLLQTYQKSTRQELTDGELWEFFRYLKSL